MSGIIAQNVGRHTGLVKAAAAGAEWTLIQTQTASSSATVDFTSGLDSTYDEYCFKFYNIHHSGLSDFAFQVNAAGGSGFNETMTTTYIQEYHDEGNTAATLEYTAGLDLAQGTASQALSGSLSLDNDGSLSGSLHFFGLANTTFVKHFLARTYHMGNGSYATGVYVAGYVNTTSAIDEVQFIPGATGNIDSGTISLFGIG